MPFNVEVLEDLDDYTGQDGATAQAAIGALGLPVILAYEYSSDLAEGLVLEQAIVEHPDGHAVVLTLSLGAGAYLDPRKIAGQRVRFNGARVFTRLRYAP